MKGSPCLGLGSLKLGNFCDPEDLELLVYMETLVLIKIHGARGVGCGFWVVYVGCLRNTYW